MLKTSPVKPLHGKSVLTQKCWETAFDADGTPCENKVRGSKGHADPTRATALRLIRVQGTRQTVRVASRRNCWRPTTSG